MPVDFESNTGQHGEWSLKTTDGSSSVQTVMKSNVPSHSIIINLAVCSLQPQWTIGNPVNC